MRPHHHGDNRPGPHVVKPIFQGVATAIRCHGNRLLPVHKIFIASNGSLSSFLSPVVPVSVNVYLGRIFLLRKALIYFSLLKTLSNILGLAFLLKEIFDFVDLC